MYQSQGRQEEAGKLIERVVRRGRPALGVGFLTDDPASTRGSIQLAAMSESLLGVGAKSGSWVLVVNHS